MKAKIVKRWDLLEDQLFIYETSMGGRVVTVYKFDQSGHLVGKRIDEGSEVPQDWCTWLSRDALKAIADASLEEYPASEATVRHLADVITVRDRLLSIVERK